MIKILSNTKQTLHLLSQGQLKDYYTEADLQAAEKLIHFSTPAVNAANLIEENYIQTPTDIYVIKEVNRSNADWVEVFGKLDTDALKSTLILTYTSEERLISEVLIDVLASTGWTYVLNDLPTRRRTIRIDEPTYAYNIIMDAMKLYGFEVWFDTVAKVVNIYQVKGSDRGAYVYTDLNLKQLEVQSDTYDFRTRLYAYGKDGLTFADINNGKEYVENHTHSTKILEAIWKDDRYTNMESLLADAQAKIDILAKPRQTYVVEVVELAKLNPIYSILDFQLGDSVKIIDKINAKQDTQRIVKLTDYPITPERNVAELANSKITIVQSNNEDAIKTAINAVSNEIIVVQTELMKAIDAATEKITGETGGNLIIRTNAEGKPYELLIMDTDDIATATNVWRWNQAGLGFSSSGYNGSYGTAITADGKINASFITVGTLSANLLKAGRIASADERFWLDLETGYFKLGGIRSDANGFVIGTEIEEAIADEVDKVGLYKVDIISSNGLVFKNGVVSTTLIARVYKNSTDVTDTINAARFKWTKTNADGTPDTAWNTSYAGGHKQVMITDEDIFQRASFKCEIMEV